MVLYHKKHLSLRLSYIKVIFLLRCLPSRVVFKQRSSSIKSCLPWKEVFNERLFSIKGLLPSKVFFHQRSSSIKECLPTKVVFNQTSSSIKGIFCDFDSFIKVRNILLQNFLNGGQEEEEIIPFPVYKTSVKVKSIL